MKVSDCIVRLLNDNKINTIFGHIGGFNADIVDSFHSNSINRFILGYHEQASAFAANAYAVVSDGLGVAMSSGAPSSCNLIAGIANAYFDSNACLFIVGSVHSKAVRQSKAIRQNAFEEVDMCSLVSDITKYAVKIDNVTEIRYEIEKAIYTATHGRRGPVLVDIPYDIARSDVDESQLKGFIPSNSLMSDETISNAYLENVREIISHSRKPIILVGGGARHGDSRKLLKQFLDKVQIPVVASLCGLDVLSHDHECFVGFVGHYGNRYANIALANADCVIILGSRLDERQMGGYKSHFAADAKLIRVDIDKNEINRRFQETVSIYGDVEKFLVDIITLNLEKRDFRKWLSTIAQWKKRYPSIDFNRGQVNANNFLYTISDYLTEDAVICSDVGQNQMSVAQSLRLDGNRLLLNSAGYGSMGFSLPAAIGAAYARQSMIVSINGDGGLQMNIQELQTLVRDNLPVNVIVLNNNCLGMIRNLQKNIFNNRTYVSVDGYSCPDYSGIAKAYGIPYLRIDSEDKYCDFSSFVSSTHPTFTEVVIPFGDNNPEPGGMLDKQKPFLSEEDCNLIQKETGL